MTLSIFPQFLNLQCLKSHAIPDTTSSGTKFEVQTGMDQSRSRKWIFTFPLQDGFVDDT
jgi:hypothetical protein